MNASESSFKGHVQLEVYKKKNKNTFVLNMRPAPAMVVMNFLSWTEGFNLIFCWSPTKSYEGQNQPLWQYQQGATHAVATICNIFEEVLTYGGVSTLSVLTTTGGGLACKNKEDTY